MSLGGWRFSLGLSQTKEEGKALRKNAILFAEGVGAVAWQLLVDLYLDVA